MISRFNCERLATVLTRLTLLNGDAQYTLDDSVVMSKTSEPELWALPCPVAITVDALILSLLQSLLALRMRAKLALEPAIDESSERVSGLAIGASNWLVVSVPEKMGKMSELILVILWCCSSLKNRWPRIGLLSMEGRLTVACKYWTRSDWVGNGVISTGLTVSLTVTRCGFDGPFDERTFFFSICKDKLNAINYDRFAVDRTGEDRWK